MVITRQGRYTFIRVYKRCKGQKICCVDLFVKVAVYVSIYIFTYFIGYNIIKPCDGLCNFIYRIVSTVICDLRAESVTFSPRKEMLREHNEGGINNVILRTKLV